MGVKDNKYFELAVFMLALYFFMFSINLMGSGIKDMGSAFIEPLIIATSNPLVGLFVGILATSIVQSSSATTSVIVALVAAGTLSLEGAIPMIMGANVGTTITNTIVSLGHATRRLEFERAFAAATVHDFFNILSILVLFPLQVFTNFLGIVASSLSSMFSGFGGAEFHSPVKAIISPLVKIIGVYLDPLLMAIVGLILLFICLKFLTGSMRKIIGSKFQAVFDKTLNKPARSLATGAGFTALVQSSSVTTSLSVPLVGAGVVRLEAIYPYVLGTNLGTTVTALLAAFATGNIVAVAVAFSHTLFNLMGILIWYPLKIVPIKAAQTLAYIVARKRRFALAYVGGVFIALPALIVLTL